MGKYCCYQITNKINGKFYRGKSTVARIKAGYFGSGLRLWEAISKYGKQNFELKILKEFNTEEEAFEYEKQIVVLDLSQSYNLKPGGIGGKQKLKWVYRDGRQIRVSPELVPALLEEGYKEGQLPGHLDNFRKASTTPEVCDRRQKSRKESGAVKRWSDLMKSPEIKAKATKHSLESRKKDGKLEKWQKAGQSPEATEARKVTIARRRVIIGSEEFRKWFGKRKENYRGPHYAVRDFLASKNKTLLEYYNSIN